MEEKQNKKKTGKNQPIHLDLSLGSNPDMGHNLYLRMLRRLIPKMVYPNFFCSSEYFEKAGWDYLHEGDTVGIVDQDGTYMLPVFKIDKNDSLFLDPESKYMAGFTGLPEPERLHERFDLEYIYNPADFVDLTGSKWKMVRKNIRWAELDMGGGLNVTHEPEKIDPIKVRLFLEDWAEGKDDIYDPETLVKFILYGDNRLFFTSTRTGELMAIVTFDFNYNYANFRYCLVKSGVRGLSDLVRVSFYRIIAYNYKFRLVNDGGCLDSETLKRYKERLNPVQINQIWSTL